MPILPSANDIGRARLQPSTQVATYDPNQVGEAEQRLGAVMQQSGRVIENTAYRVDQWAHETAALHAQDALVQLKQAQNEMTVGPDGYAQLQNGDATKPGVMQKYQDKFKTKVGELGQQLGPLARGKFEQAAKRQQVDYEAGFLSHAMNEDLKHRGQVYKANIEVSANTIGANYNNPVTVNRELNNIDRTVAEYVVKNGITDSQLRQKLLLDARTVAHQAVIEGYMQNDQPKAAEEYLTTVEGEMDTKAVGHARDTLRPQIATKEGRDIAEKLFAMHVAGKSESDIFTEKLKATEGKSLETMRVADAIYDDRVRAREKDRREVQGSVVLDSRNIGVENALKSDTLKNLDATDPVLATKIRNQLVALGQGEAGKKGTTTTYAGMQLYAELSQRIDDSEVPPSPQEIASYMGILPEKQINALMKKSASKDKAADKATIDPDLINMGMPKSAKDPQLKMAFKGAVEKNKDEWKAANPGKVMTLEDKMNIVNKANEEYVQVGTIFNSKIFNSTKEAYRADPTRSYPKTFGQLMKGYNNDDILAAYAHAQRIRQYAPKGSRPYTDAELIRAWETINKKQPK